MPQINRIRIINFSYNNDSRHITDEVFDLYQGENALFNLKNGGGKSVLVQLMMQPIVPKTRLMGRRIEDFFKGRKTPSYIMIEWKLEDQGGYLLTGICIANRESQSRYQEDSSYNSLKYFTFTSTYISSNKFDILSIPFVKKQGERIYIEEYKEARNLITSSESKYNLKFFDYDDRLEYSKHLNSFNISQDEWKTIILKINESEGGVIEIFEKCRTSQQLMNDWILKTVEKVVNKDEKELKKLEAMLENLADDMIENEKYIYEKEIFQDFLVESRKYFDKINDLVLSIEKEEKLEKKMAGLCYFLNKEIDIINKEVDNKENEIYKSEEELKRIDLEEKSKEYYDIKGKIDDLDKLHKEDLSKLEILKKKIESLEKDELILKASGEFKKINELKNQLAGLIEEIRKIKNKKLRIFSKN
jgi:energy-coupling factor transporter ATP-binding protein EcfA2